jgi:fumarate hydratase, class II
MGSSNSEVFYHQCSLCQLPSFRSLQNFDIGGKKEVMPIQVIKAMATIKKAAAAVNSTKFGLLPANLAKAIMQASDEAIL